MVDSSSKSIYKHFRLAKPLESDGMYIDYDNRMEDEMDAYNVALELYNTKKKQNPKTKPPIYPVVKHVALICGSEGTPYQGGFFMFELKYSREYPRYPPDVKFLNVTAFNRGRLHPNLYQVSLDGKVCLSLIGTWGQNTWNKNTSSIGEILLAIKAIVLVSSPLNGEPPYNHPISKQIGYTYSVSVLTFMDYIIGTITKMNNGSFQSQYIEPFKDIIMDYVQNEKNRRLYIEMYNNLVIDTKINMNKGIISEMGEFVQTFYNISLFCNLKQLEEVFTKTFNPTVTDGFIVPINFDFGKYNPIKCNHIFKTGKNKGCQCSFNKKELFCSIHSSKYPDVSHLSQTPVYMEILGLSPPLITQNKSTDTITVDKLKCCAILMSGANKGKQCSCNSLKDSYFCGRHKKLSDELNTGHSDLSFADKFNKTPVGMIDVE
jgi:ubiquitin-protein ligase